MRDPDFITIKELRDVHDEIYSNMEELCKEINLLKRVLIWAWRAILFLIIADMGFLLALFRVGEFL